jgi:hypothetical protein
MQEERKVLDSAINNLFYTLEGFPPDSSQDGAFNYTISMLIHKLYPTTYRNINRVVGVLECVKQEYYRTVAAPYEDTKRIANGELF